MRRTRFFVKKRTALAAGALAFAGLAILVARFCGGPAVEGPQIPSPQKTSTPSKAIVEQEKPRDTKKAEKEHKRRINLRDQTQKIQSRFLTFEEQELLDLYGNGDCFLLRNRGDIPNEVIQAENELLALILGPGADWQDHAKLYLRLMQGPNADVKCSDGSPVYEHLFGLFMQCTQGWVDLRDVLSVVFDYLESSQYGARNIQQAIEYVAMYIDRMLADKSRYETFIPELAARVQRAYEKTGDGTFLAYLAKLSPESSIVTDAINGRLGDEGIARAFNGLPDDYFNLEERRSIISRIENPVLRASHLLNGGFVSELSDFEEAFELIAAGKKSFFTDSVFHNFASRIKKLALIANDIQPFLLDALHSNNSMRQYGAAVVLSRLYFRDEDGMWIDMPDANLARSILTSQPF